MEPKNETPSTILIVDDAAELRRRLGAVLEQAGYRVVEAATVDAARAVVAEAPPDLVLLDVVLPDGSGFQLCEEWREQTAPELPVIFMSSLGEPDDIAAGFLAGAVDYLAKPVNPVELRARVGIHLKLRRQQAELARSRAFLQRAQESAHIGCWQWDLASGAVEWSDEVYRIFGLEPGSVEPSYELAASLVHPDDRERWAAGASRFPAGDKPVALEYRAVRRDDQRVIWVRNEAHVVPDDTGDATEVLGTVQEVTAAHLAREELERSEARYRTLFEDAPVGIALADADTGVVVDCNRELLRMVGRPRDHVVGHPQRRLYPLEDGGKVFGGFQAHRGDTSGTALRQQLLTADGELREVEVMAMARQVDDRPHLIGFFRDLSAELRAEAALVDSERRLGRLLETAQEGVWVVDGAGRTTFVNAKACALLGYVAEELLGRHPAEFMDAEEAEKIHWHIARRREGISERYETRFVRKDGGALWTLVSASPIYDDAGEFDGSLAMLTDITDHRRAREEMERLGKAVEQAAEHIVITDIEGTIVYVNPAFEQVTGFTEAEALGSNPRILKSGDHDEAFYRDLWQTISDGRVWSGRFTNRRKDGSTFREDATISPLRDGSGTIVNYVAVKRDITAELELAEQFRQSQKMEAVGQLASGVAHDFNNLLMIILGSCELLSEHLPDSAPLRKHLEPIRQAGDRAAGLTRQLLAFSRKQLMQPQVLQLNEVVDQTTRMLGRLVGEDVRVEFRRRDGLWSVYADQGQVEQIVLNLAVNARDAMPRGGTLQVELSNVVVDPGKPGLPSHQPAPGEYVLLELVDDGVGMDAATRERAFEPFFTTKQKGKGTGLGLATVYGIVKQSDGYVYVDSAVGKGTRFRIYLPRWSRPAAAPGVEHPLEVVAGGVGTVLVIEDEANVRNLVCATLAGTGHRVLEAEDGEEAIRVAEDQPGAIDLIVCDVVLPGMSGPEAVAAIQKLCPEVAVVYASGYPDETITRHGVLVPEVAFLQKPFSRDALRRKVAELLCSRTPGGGAGMGRKTHYRDG